MTTLKIAPGFALPLDLVTEATAIVATRGAGKSSASAVIVEEGVRVGVQTVIFDRTGVYWGLRSNADGDGPGLAIYVLGGPHGDVPLEPTAGAVIANLIVDSGHSFVLDLSDFSKGHAVKFAADLLERLYDRKARSRTTTLLVLDEAHFYAPQTPRGGFKGDAARLMGAMEDVVGLGRSRGLGAVLTTQRTQALNKAVLDLIETLFVMRMLSDRARNAVRGWIQEKDEEDRGVIDSLDSLPTGTAWVWSPLRGVLEKVGLRRIRTFDSYATPKPGEARVEPTARKELNLEALGEQMRATIERAKAEDPRELRRQIADLRNELSAAERQQTPAPPPEPVVEYVDKPVLRDEDVEALREIVEGLGEHAGRIIAAANDIGNGLRKVTSHVPRVAEPLRQQAPPVARPAPPPRAPAREAPVTDGELTRSLRKILDALAMLQTFGIMQPTRVQVAVFVGESHKGGAFNNKISRLRTAGYIDYPQQGLVALTDAGASEADAGQAPSTVEEMHGLARGLVGPARSRILDVLIGVYPDAISREELAEQVGEVATGGAFNNKVSRLRSLGLADYPQQGYVAAAPVLFLEAAA